MCKASQKIPSHVRGTVSFFVNIAILCISPIHEARMDRPESDLIQRMSVELLVMAGIGLVLGLLGPFGTYPMPLALRLAYWLGFILIGYAIFRPITRAAGWLHEMSKIPFPLAISIAVLTASLPLAFLIGFAVNGMQVGGPMLTSGFATLYMQCAGIGIVIFLLMRMIFPGERAEPTVEASQDHSPQTPDAAVQKSRLHDRLSPGFPDHIHALSVEDHYVRVHAADCSEMLLMRLRDAIAETQPLEGMQVHRSWWIARDAITKSKRDGRNLKIILANGLEAPVSRAYAGRLKQTGWID